MGRHQSHGPAEVWRRSRLVSGRDTGSQVVVNYERQMALWNCDLADDEDDHHSNVNLKSSGQDDGANTS